MRIEQDDNESEMDAWLFVLCQSAVYSGLLNHNTLNQDLCCTLQSFERIVSG